MNSKMIFQKIRKIDLIKFFKYNFLMPQVKRTKGAYIIPFKGAILEIDKTAEIVLNGTIHFGINHLKGSKAETYIRLGAIDGTNGADVVSSIRCRTEKYDLSQQKVNVNVGNSGIKYGVFFYDAYGKYISWTGWIAGTEYAVPANASYAKPGSTIDFLTS